MAHSDRIQSTTRRPNVNRWRVAAMLAGLIVVGLGVGLTGNWGYAPTAGWATACLIYLIAVWRSVHDLDAAATSKNATREDPKRTLSDLLFVIASIASLFALVFVFGQAKAATGLGKDVIAGLAFLSVVLSWLLVHTIYTLRYAELYYSGGDGGIDFNQPEPPKYTDFAYLSFTVGMTFQVSDTNIQDSLIRSTILRHMFLAYLFGSVIIATTVNLVAGLAT